MHPGELNASSEWDMRLNSLLGQFGIISTNMFVSGQLISLRKLIHSYLDWYSAMGLQNTLLIPLVQYHECEHFFEIIGICFIRYRIFMLIANFGYELPKYACGYSGAQLTNFLGGGEAPKM